MNINSSEIPRSTLPLFAHSAIALFQQLKDGDNDLGLSLGELRFLNNICEQEGMDDMEYSALVRRMRAGNIISPAGINTAKSYTQKKDGHTCVTAEMNQILQSEIWKQIMDLLRA